MSARQALVQTLGFVFALAMAVLALWMVAGCGDERPRRRSESELSWIRECAKYSKLHACRWRAEDLFQELPQ